MSALKQLCVIAERKNENKIRALLSCEGANFVHSALAHGTARSELLSVLGLDSTDKILIVATASEDSIKKINAVLIEKYKFGKGAGISFSLPVTAVSSPAAALVLTGGEL